MTAKTPRDWRELCRKASEEMDPDKLMDLVVEINQALDEHIKKRKGIAENVTDTERKSESRQSEVTFLKIHQRPSNYRIFEFAPFVSIIASGITPQIVG